LTGPSDLFAENQEGGWVSKDVVLWLRERKRPVQREEGLSWCGVFR